MLGESLKASGTRHDMLALVAPDMSARARRMLQDVGWTLVPVEPLTSNWDKRKNTYCMWNHRWGRGGMRRCEGGHG